jgi:hypothetical protein
MMEIDAAWQVEELHYHRCLDRLCDRGYSSSLNISLVVVAVLVVMLKYPRRSVEGAACRYALWQDRRRETAGAAW